MSIEYNDLNLPTHLDGFRHRVGKEGNSIDNLLLTPILTLI